MTDEVRLSLSVCLHVSLCTHTGLTLDGGQLAPGVPVWVQVGSGGGEWLEGAVVSKPADGKVDVALKTEQARPHPAHAYKETLLSVCRCQSLT
jgi:hypothetical protein